MAPKNNSFNGDTELYHQWVAQLKNHIDRGQMIRGIGWENGQGNLIGCSVHEWDYTTFSDSLGLPQEIGEIGESLFSSCGDDESACEFAEAMALAMQVGANYEGFLHRWCTWLILDPVGGVRRHNTDPLILEIGQMHAESISFSIPLDQWQAVFTKAARIATTATSATNTSINTNTGMRDKLTALVAQSAAYAAEYTAARASFEDAIYALHAASESASKVSAYAYLANTADNINGDDIGDLMRIHTRLAMAAQRRYFLELLKDPVFTDCAQ